MNTPLGLDKLTAPLKGAAKLAAPEIEKGAPIALAGAAVAMSHYGAAVNDPRGSALVNVGALAVAARGTPAVYHCRPSAARVVHETDLHSIPAEPPPLLRRPGIVEVRRPETGERLWGDVFSIGWYTVEGAQCDPPRLTPTTFLIGLEYDGSALAARWTPTWTGEEIDEQLPAPEYGSSLIEAVDTMHHHQFAQACARFLVVFGLLERIEHGPLRFELDKKTGRRNVWTGDSYLPHGKPKPPRVDGLIDPIDPARVLGDARIQGHLKRVRTGEGRRNVEYRYIQGYTGKRWFGPRYTVERDHKHTGLANDLLTYRGKKP